MSRSPVDWKRIAFVGGALILVVSPAVVANMGRASHPRTASIVVPARSSTQETLGVAEGMPLASYQVSGVSEPTDGAVLVRARSPNGEVTYEVWLASDTPLPAAKGGPYAVYYRSSDAGADVLAGAVALGHILERAPSSPPLAGLTTYPFTTPP
jgi:hypothetical protein